MDRSKINLARLYTKIDLTKTKLDRDKNGNDPVAPEINKMAPVYPKIEGKLARRTEGIPPGLKYDPQAEINYQLNGEPMGPYTLQIEPVGALMFFGRIRIDRFCAPHATTGNSSIGNGQTKISIKVK
jgi:hypothetical protein